MNQTIRIFVNTRALDLPAGSDVRQAVRAFDQSMEASIADGTALVTDGRGIEVDPATQLSSGAILRIVQRARKGADADA
jgi:hypothetical protein